MKLLFVLLLASSFGAQNEIRGPLRVLDDDGAWCWFQGERAVVVDGRLLVGTVSSGVHDPTRHGDINLIVHGLESGTTRVEELHDQLECDDHDSPAIVPLPDGRILTMYARHGNDSLVRTRVGKIGEWGAERTLEIDSKRHGVTYSNAYRLEGGRLVDLFRGPGWNPHFIASDDDGLTWSAPQMLIEGPGRPYLRYVASGDSVHFVCTEQHPRNYDNGLLHGVLRAGEVLASDGARVAKLEEGPAAVGALTRVLEGSPEAVAWCSDLRLDALGRPVIVYWVQLDGADQPQGKGGLDHRYRQARFDGKHWYHREIGYAGRRLYAGEDDYTGLIVLDPNDVRTVVFSTDADPVTGEPLVSRADGARHYELFRGRTEDHGLNWTFEPLTRNSNVDNLRPVFAVGAKGAAQLIWLRGSYRSYTDFELAVVALTLEHELPDFASR